MDLNEKHFGVPDFIFLEIVTKWKCRCIFLRVSFNKCQIKCNLGIKIWCQNEKEILTP